MTSLSRGDNFRKAFSEISDVRSLVPETVRLMALTATASKETRRSVCKTLGMCKPAIISEPPNRTNIKFILHANVSTLEESFDPLVQELRHRRSTMDRVIIYCRTYHGVYFKASLGAESTEPVGTFDLARLICSVHVLLPLSRTPYWSLCANQDQFCGSLQPR